MRTSIMLPDFQMCSTWISQLAKFVSELFLGGPTYTISDWRLERWTCNSLERR
jgi:hypothetical protein